MAYESSKTGFRSGGGNWSGDMADALIGMGDSFAAQSASEKESALRAEALGYSRGRDKLNDTLGKDARALALAQYNDELKVAETTAKLTADYRLNEQANKQTNAELLGAHQAAVLAGNQSAADATAKWRANQQTAAKTALELVASQNKALSDGLEGYSKLDAGTAALAASPELNSAGDQRKNDLLTVRSQNLVAEALGGQVGVTSRDDIRRATIGGAPRVTSDLPSAKDLPMAIQQGLDDGSISKERYELFLANNKADGVAIDKYLVSKMPVYRQEETTRLTKKFVTSGGDPAKSFALATEMAKQYPSKAELSLAAKDAQKTANRRNVYLADRAFDMYKAENKGKNTSGVTPGYTGIAEVVAHIEKIDPGMWDSGTLENRYQLAIKEGVNPKIALKALDKYVTLKGFGKGVTGTDDDYLKFAKDLEAASKSNGSRSSYDEFIAKEAVLVDPVFRNHQAFLGGLRDFGVKPNTPHKFAQPYYDKKVPEIVETAQDKNLLEGGIGHLYNTQTTDLENKIALETKTRDSLNPNASGSKASLARLNASITKDKAAIAHNNETVAFAKDLGVTDLDTRQFGRMGNLKNKLVDTKLVHLLASKNYSFTELNKEINKLDLGLGIGEFGYLTKIIRHMNSSRRRNLPSF
jgi:hypothetical protein